jgi:nucleotide-binding universal stress UspA family protein
MARPTVLVGVGGSSGWEALAWAVDEAAGTGGDVRIVHACPPESPLAHTSDRVAPGLLELADPGLARAVAAARSRLGGTRVSLLVRPDRAGDLVLSAAEQADLVVVGAPTGHAATVHQVVTRAHCPTVVVHPVRAGRERPFAGHVVVGVCDEPPARAALEFAFGYAAAHRARLAAVHVSAERRADHRFEPGAADPGEPAGLDLLAVEVEPWTHKYPEVTVTRAVLAGRPLPGLLRAAQGARLLVVGDRGRGAAARRLLGSVSHGVLDRAGCPVALVRPDHSRGRF